MSRSAISLVQMHSSPLTVDFRSEAPSQALRSSHNVQSSPGHGEPFAAAAAAEESFEVQEHSVSKAKTATIIACVTCITTISSLLNGLVIVAIPTIARELDLGPNLVLWCV